MTLRVIRPTGWEYYCRRHPPCHYQRLEFPGCYRPIGVSSHKQVEELEAFGRNRIQNFCYKKFPSIHYGKVFDNVPHNCLIDALCLCGTEPLLWFLNDAGGHGSAIIYGLCAKCELVHLTYLDSIKLYAVTVESRPMANATHSRKYHEPHAEHSVGNMYI